MRFRIDVGGELELKLHQAILLYRNEQASRYMATVHGIAQSESGGAPVLGAGQLLTTAVLREWSRTLGTACPVEFLPVCVVARAPELLAWWTPAMIRSMFFRTGSELADVSGRRFPHPALQFVVRNGLLYVRALRSNHRPSSETKLYTFATLIVMAVFLPLFAMTGIEGKMYSPLAAAVVSAIGASLVLALTLVPVVAGLFLRPRSSVEEEDVWIIRKLKRVYAPFLDRALRHRWKVLIVAFVITVPALVLALYVGSDFMPKLDEGAFVVGRVANFSRQRRDRFSRRCH